MSTHHCAVEDQVLHVGFIHKVGVHLLPDAFVAPASKAFVYAVPLAILCWQQAPLRSTPHDPQHAFDKPSAGRFLPDIHVGTRSQEVQDFRPLFIRQFNRHGAEYAPKCQQNLA
jgi:hypothetical protein